MRRRQFLAASVGTAAIPALARRSRASQASSFEPRGRVPVSGIAEAVVGDDGTTAYAAVTDGFASVDVSDPADPTVLAERRSLLPNVENGPLVEIWDVKVDGDLLAVVGPANGRRNALEAVVFYDVADPADPQRLGVHETGYPIHNCDLADGVAYLTENHGERIGLATVTAGANPERLGGWSLTDVDERWGDVQFALSNLHDVYVQDGLAYLAHWDAGTWVVDVADPADPSLVARVTGPPLPDLLEFGDAAARRQGRRRPGNDHYAAVDESGDLLGIGIEAWGQPGPGGIELWDVSDLESPKPLARIDPPPIPQGENASYTNGVWTTAHNFEFDDDRLYTSWYQGGVKVFDVADPENPEEIAAWRDTDEACFWTARTAADCFVASSVSHPPSLDVTDRLYTFPIPDDSAAQPRTEPGDTSTDGGDTASDETDATPGRTAGTTTGETGTGFGVFAGLAGLGLGAWRAANRDR
ncbi:LVIVD repeat-containing protein [Halorientalis halophila]|uniref:LVIVD repeat-containing protein n=1 Tax=Halorientalis halophila TaxID=3108499 RepID=UPI0030080B96